MKTSRVLRVVSVGVVFAISSFSIMISLAYVRCFIGGTVFDLKAIWFIVLKGCLLIGLVVTGVTAIGEPGPRDGR